MEKIDKVKNFKLIFIYTAEFQFFYTIYLDISVLIYIITLYNVENNCNACTLKLCTFVVFYLLPVNADGYELLYRHSPVQELESLLSFDRSFATAEVNALGRITATIGRHKRRTKQRETADGDRKHSTEGGHGCRRRMNRGPPNHEMSTYQQQNKSDRRARRSVACE